MDRRTFVGTSGLLLAGTLLGGVPIVGGKSGKRKMEADGLGFPLMDLHVHRSSELSMEEILETSRNLNLKIGVMENVAPWGILESNSRLIDFFVCSVAGMCREI